MKKSVSGIPVAPSEERTLSNDQNSEAQLKESVTKKVPELPADEDHSLFQSSVEFDESLTRPNEDISARVMSHGKNHLDYLTKFGIRDKISIAWPKSLYIPAKADWKDYWVLPAPNENLYSYSWTPAPSPGGFNMASKDDGNLYSFQQLRSIDKFAQTEAGLGVLYVPDKTLSVVSFQPQLKCISETRWYAMYNNLIVAGTTFIKTSLILAVWQSIPGPSAWELVNYRQIEVAHQGPESGSGFAQVMHNQRNFSGKDLATQFLVQSYRTYLFGVVARVSIWSTLTDSNGRPLPLIQDGSFRVWGVLSCVIPQIEIYQYQVHIP